MPGRGVNAMNKRKLLITGACLALVALVADQVLLYTALADGRFLGRCIAPFDPPLFIQPQFAHLEDSRRAAAGDRQVLARSIFDAELGWCPRPDSEAFGAHFDGLAERSSGLPHAAFPASGSRRVLTLGGSFTLGMEVKDLEAWPARVEARGADTEVVNLGVAGYGLDQAYLRYLRDGRSLGAEEVWFGLMPQATLRVSTHYAPAFYRWATMIAFKPRFLPDDGAGVRLVPNPASNHADTVRLLTDQDAFVEALGETDLWVRRAPAAFAPRGSHPSHWFGSTRLLLTLHEGGNRDRAVWLEDRESEVYRVMRDVLLAFHASCAEDGAALKIIVLPSRADLRLRDEAGHGFWDSLLAELREQGVESLDTSGALAEAGAPGDDGLWMPGSHYSVRGNEIVAGAVLEGFGLE